MSKVTPAVFKHRIKLALKILLFLVSASTLYGVFSDTYENTFFLVRDATGGIAAFILFVMLQIDSTKSFQFNQFWDSQEALHPNTPYKWRKDWLKGSAKSAVKDELITKFILLFFISGSIPLLYQLSQQDMASLKAVWDDPEYGPTVFFATLFGACFLIGVIYFSFNKEIKGILSKLKFGSSTVHFKNPILTGEIVNFSVDLPKKIRSQKVVAKFKCIQMELKSTPGGGYSEHERVFWSSEVETAVDSFAQLKLGFEVSKGLRATEPSHPNIEWVLEVRTHKKSKLSFYTSFVVPVQNP